jgi:hypothetical protein
MARKKTNDRQVPITFAARAAEKKAVVQEAAKTEKAARLALAVAKKEAAKTVREARRTAKAAAASHRKAKVQVKAHERRYPKRQ